MTDCPMTPQGFSIIPNATPPQKQVPLGEGTGEFQPSLVNARMEERMAAESDDRWTAAKVRCSKKLLDIVRADFRDKEKVDLNRDLFSRLV